MVKIMNTPTEGRERNAKIHDLDGARLVKTITWVESEYDYSGLMIKLFTYISIAAVMTFMLLEVF